MEKAVLKTLIYADIFGLPLKAWEIHKWLLNKKCDLLDVEKALNRLLKSKKIIYKNDFFALSGREKIIYKRKSKTVTQQNLKRVKFITGSIKLIPWVKMVGIYKDWSMKKVSQKDPVKLFVVTSKNRLGISKLIIETILTGVEKIYLGQILEEEQLEYREKNLYTAHQVLQMQPVWQKDKAYAKYLNANTWAFGFLPNWITAD